LAQYKPKIGQFWADSLPKKISKLFDNDFAKIQSKIGSKKGPKKPAGPSGKLLSEGIHSLLGLVLLNGQNLWPRADSGNAH
jgi:hypothetical protein